MVFFMPGVGCMAFPVKTSIRSQGSPFQAPRIAIIKRPLTAEQYVHMDRSYFR